MAGRDPIYDFYTPCEDKKYLSCKSCKRNISRGSSEPHKANSSNLIKHLKTATHKELFDEYTIIKTKLEEKKSKEKVKNVQKSSKIRKVTHQPTMEEILLYGQPWKPNDQKSIELDKFVFELIVCGGHPFTIVNEESFIRLVRKLQPHAVLKSDKYYRHMLNQAYDSVFNKIKEKVSVAEYISCTTDVWTNDAKTASLLSVTAHYVDLPTASRPKVVLAAIPLKVDHTGENLKECLYECVCITWGIHLNKIHAMAHDNGANIVKAVTDSEIFASIRCFAHTLQLVIENGIDSQRVVKDLLATCRLIVGHFKRSEAACRYFEDIQKEIGLPQHRLIQSVATRWNSSFYMLQRLLEQREAVVLYDARYGLPATLTGHTWQIASKVVELLQPIEAATKEISYDSTTASIIIPFVTTIKMFLQPKPGDEGGVGTMRATMLAGMNSRFYNILTQKPLLLATFLDPRFKGNGSFLSRGDVENAVAHLKQEFGHDDDTALQTQNEMEDVRRATTSQEQIGDPNPNNRPRLQVSQPSIFALSEDSRKHNFNFWDLVQKVSSDENSRVMPIRNSIEDEIEQYTSLPNESNECNIFQWWYDSKFIRLKKAACKYLSATATSVPSEQLFSSAGDLYDDKRSSLKAENAEKILFLQKNIPLLNYEW